MNAIELVLSIPEIKSEHPRLYSQALGELETMKGQSARIAELEARVKELEAALEPFAHPDLCTKRSGNAEGDASPIFGRDKAVITLGDCRRARALLETK